MKYSVEILNNNNKNKNKLFYMFWNNMKNCNNAK